LQALNNVLQGLGLNWSDIQQIDQIASLTNDFNPTAFTSLAYRLAALASNPAQQPAPTPAAGGQQTSAPTKAVTP
jgi:hypothetical protein